MCYGLGAWCLSTWKVSLVMLRAVETFWEIFRICKTPGFLQHSWRLSIGDSHEKSSDLQHAMSGISPVGDIQKPPYSGLTTPVSFSFSSPDIRPWALCLPRLLGPRRRDRAR